MRAVRFDEYGDYDVLKVVDVPEPETGDRTRSSSDLRRLRQPIRQHVPARLGGRRSAGDDPGQ